MFNIQIVIGSQWVTSHRKLSAWLSDLIQAEIEYHYGTPCRIVRGE